MKTKHQKQTDLDALTEKFATSNSAMVIGFDKLTVTKDQELRNKIREVGASYRVVKNTLAEKAVQGTSYEDAKQHFVGMTGIAFAEKEPVELAKALTKFVKDNGEIYKFKAGIVEGRVVDAKQIEAIATLPSREELISKFMFVLNAQAQRIATVINAVPRNLAVVIKQIGDQKGE